MKVGHGKLARVGETIHNSFHDLLCSWRAKSRAKTALYKTSVPNLLLFFARPAHRESKNTVHLIPSLQCFTVYSLFRAHFLRDTLYLEHTGWHGTRVNNPYLEHTLYLEHTDLYLTQHTDLYLTPCALTRE